MNKNKEEKRELTNNWQGFRGFRRVFCDKLQKHGQGEENCNCKRDFFYKLKAFTRLSKKFKQNSLTILLPPESGGSQNTNKASVFFLIKIYFIIRV